MVRRRNVSPGVNIMTKEWIEWKGGERPVTKGKLVDTKSRDHWVTENVYAGGLDWRHDGNFTDIIAWRPHANEQRGQPTQAAWSGKGLPPVGVKCEHCPGGTTQVEWEVVTVAGIHENRMTGFTDYWLVRENGSSYTIGNPYRFRPLCNEAERKREDAIKAMINCSAVLLNPTATLIYNAIAAGEIPGVKLENEND